MNENNNCIFCKPTNVIINGQYAYSKLDEFPVSKGHCLVIPKRHVKTIWELTDEELKDLYAVLIRTKHYLEDLRPDGFNIGINEGKAAGQTVEHLHIHLIPRYVGDVPNPTGGVRGVIPGKRNYLKERYYGDEDCETDPYGILTLIKKK